LILVSSLQVEVLRSSDTLWDERLRSTTSDVYHRSGYHRHAEATDGGTAYLAVIRDGNRAGLIWPYLVRPIAGVDELADRTGSDIDSVYGYPGPLAWGAAPGDEFVRHASEELVALWREQGGVTAFTRFHPILSNEQWAEQLGAGGPDGAPPIVQVGETVGIDLRQEGSSIVAGYRKTLRQEIARARRAGLSSRLDEDWSSLGIFTALYRDTMTRTRAAESYFYVEEDFRALKSELGEELHLFVTEADGRTAAAGLFTEHQGIVQAHLVGTDEAFRAWSPLKLLLDDVRSWASERGDHVFHLGGGRGGRDDSLMAFKRRFSALRFRFAVGRWVLDPVAYADLIAAHRTRTADAGWILADRAYFPSYRTPVTKEDAVFTIVTRETEAELAEIFSEIDDSFFRPHPFTREEARRIAGQAGRDVYALLMDGTEPIAYGMLRGWDEGYTTPSLGIAVRSRWRRRGYGRQMMEHLHSEARRRGAQHVRLRVHPQNVAARSLYESLGYVPIGEDRGELVMMVDLDRTGSLRGRSVPVASWGPEHP
jgi:ribosomal protein S18 acetylase RimI-like enzyme